MSGDAKENPRDKQRYQWVPPGKLNADCSDQKAACVDTTQPDRADIKSGYWIGATECTVGAYKRFASVTGRSMPPASKWQDREFNPGWRDNKMPIVNVTWEEAKSFCSWTGGRLPTEVEWEYAARSGDERAQLTAGLDAAAWDADNSGDTAIDSAGLSKAVGEKALGAKLFDNHNGPHEVGMKEPNSRGLYDMLGNVWEWTSGTYNSGGSTLALRGGSWGNVPELVRVTARGQAGPAHRSNSIGFRCVIDEPR
jgi:formylglycine-generating enzyme